MRQFTSIPLPSIPPRWRRVMLGLIALVLTVSSSLAPGQGGDPTAIPPSRQASNIAIITIRTGDDPIDGVTAKSFIRRLRIAERAGADAIIIELDTPGGQVGAVLDITQAIKGSSIRNSVAWINPQAISGGAIIALACQEIVIADPAQMGDALPIVVSPISGLQQLPEAERSKMLVPLLQDMLDSARRHNSDSYEYDEYLVQAMVARGIELWWVRNTQTGVEMAINRREYRLLFGADAPVGERVRIGSLNLGSGASPSTVAPLPSPSGAPALPGPPADDTAFQPGGPRLDNLSEAVSSGLELSTRRPTLTSANAGQWQLVEKICDGSVPLLLNSGEMWDYNFAANAKGSPIRTDEDLKAWMGASNLSRLDPLWSEGLVSFMTSFWVRGLLMVVFLLGMFLEMTHPGVGVPALVSITALTALLVPPYLMGLANWWEILAIFGGIGLILLEIFVIPGFGVPGIIGLVLLFGGLLGTFLPDQGGHLFPDSPDDQKDLLFGLLTMILALVSSGVGMWLFGKHLGTIPLFSKLILSDTADDEHSLGLLAAMAPPTVPRISAGMTGQAITNLRPAGKAQFGDAVVDVVAEFGYISPGATVRITSVGGFRTTVELVADDPDAGGLFSGLEHTSESS